VHRLRRLLEGLGRQLARVDLWDALVALGGLLVAIGIWAIYWPAALITLGAALVGLGWWGARVWNRGSPPR
jgi:hypothetical protein